MEHFNLEDAGESLHTHPARDAERSLQGEHERGESAYLHGTINRVHTAPIGVFDSGAGGLTVLSALRQELPHENYIYLGDTAHCPYGNRSEAEIIELSSSAIRFLIEQGAKLIVVACNTVSQAALSTLRATFPVPFVGVVPAVKPAARATKKGRIGIAATNAAAKAIYLRQLVDEFAEGISVYAVGCPELVTLVEQGQLEGPLVEETVRQALQPILAEDVDVIVLGCTHFPALRSVIEHITENRVQILDSGTAVARRTHAVLEAEELISPFQQGGEIKILCSGDPLAFSSVASKLLRYEVVARQIKM